MYEADLHQAVFTVDVDCAPLFTWDLTESEEGFTVTEVDKNSVKIKFTGEIPSS